MLSKAQLFMTTKNPEKNDHQLLIDILKETQVNGEYLKIIAKTAEDLRYLLNGFTSGGASFNGYLPDTATLAYLILAGPVLARRLDNVTGIEEILKGLVHLSTQVTEEFSAYKSEQQQKDILNNALEFLKTNESTAE
ncbi:MAG: hypothetical protein CMA30_08870 [Euryarchaeota archaeon]|jgi:hypothetical protein|nr:hypothetical protein [Euryarchaeota archaeon]|tara:strand:- start:1768 stop:2178 length:411 start_codon:yes stop_codon:yes gene_type:complete